MACTFSGLSVALPKELRFPRCIKCWLVFICWTWLVHCDMQDQTIQLTAVLKRSDVTTISCDIGRARYSDGRTQRGYWRPCNGSIIELSALHHWYYWLFFWVPFKKNIIKLLITTRKQKQELNCKIFQNKAKKHWHIYCRSVRTHNCNWWTLRWFYFILNCGTRICFERE